jgi:hypothetical protein
VHFYWLGRGAVVLLRHLAGVQVIVAGSATAGWLALDWDWDWRYQARLPNDASLNLSNRINENLLQPVEQIGHVIGLSAH